MSVLHQFHQQFLAEFGKFESRLNGSRQHPVHSVRKELLTKFSGMPFPTVKDEEWKYTNLSALGNQSFGVSARDITEVPQTMFFNSVSEVRLVFANGKFRKELSTLGTLPAGITVLPLKEAVVSNYSLLEGLLSESPEQATLFDALNGAFLEEGVLIHASKDAVLNTPVHIAYYSDFNDAGYCMPRTVIACDKFSKLTVIESFHGNSGSRYFTNAVVQVQLAEGAYCEHIKIQDESTKAFHISTVKAECAQGAKFTSYNVNFGGQLVRNDITVTFTGENADCVLNGLTLSSDTQLIDNHTLIDHAVPHCTSSELYKGVLGGKSRGVFNGKVLVRKDAQKTQAFQQNKNILLTSEAHIDTKPQLEIFADDVKCSHGATIGQLDKKAKFYLKSRGFSEELANSTLVYAFASDVVHNLDIPEVRDYLEARIEEKLSVERK